MKNWIKEISIQRSTLYSNGVIVQTDDNKRVDQLLQSMRSHYPDPIICKENDEEGTPVPERWLILDSWDGLLELKETLGNNGTEWKTNVIKDSRKYGGELRPILPDASIELEKGHTVLLIKNLLNEDKHLNNALLSWATSAKLMNVGSTVLVFTEDMNFFPQAVWQKMKVIDVPKACADERISLIKTHQEGCHPLLDEQEIQSTSRLLAGLNLDQIDASLVESVIRKQCVNADLLARTKEDILGKDPTIDLIQRPKFGFEAIGGYDALKQRLRDDVILPLQNPELAQAFSTDPPRGIILFGPPGTGKTIMTKAMSRELNMSVLALKPENFMSKYVGESQRLLKRAFKIADSMAPTIVFIDEIDRLAKRSSTGGGDAGAQVHREIFSMFLEKLGDEKRKWFFVGCTNRIEDIDEAMRRTGRVDSIAPVPYPNEKAREEIFRIHASLRRNLPLADDVSFKKLASNANTYMWGGSDVEQLVVRTAKYVMKECIKEGKQRDITMQDFRLIHDTFNVDAQANEELQEHTKEQARRLSNDTRLMDIFEEAQSVKIVSRAEKAKEMMKK